MKYLNPTGSNGVPLGFDFPHNGTQIVSGKRQYVAPFVSGPNFLSNRTRADLGTAFESAPIFLKKLLCNKLNYVLVDDTDYGGRLSLGWAYWEEKALGQGNGNGRFIAVSGQLWKGPGIGLPDLVKNMIEYSIPGSTFPLKVAAQTIPADSAPGQGPTWAAVLAILAREAGFVVERDISAGNVIQYTCPNGSDYYSYSWTENWRTRPLFLGTIRTYAMQQTYSYHLSSVPGSDDIVQDVQTNDSQKNLSPHLQQIYDSQHPEFLDLISVWGPDTDFVSVFMASMLQQSSFKLAQISVAFNGGPWAQEITNLNNPGSTLLQKSQCMKAIETAYNP